VCAITIVSLCLLFLGCVGVLSLPRERGVYLSKCCHIEFEEWKNKFWAWGEGGLIGDVEQRLLCTLNLERNWIRLLF